MIKISFVLYLQFIVFSSILYAQKTAYYSIHFSQHGPNFPYKLKMTLNDKVVFDDSVHQTMDIAIEIKEGTNVLKVLKEYPFWRWIEPNFDEYYDGHTFYRNRKDPKSFINTGKIVFHSDSVKKYFVIWGKELNINKRLKGRKPLELTTYFKVNYNAIEWSDERFKYK